MSSNVMTPDPTTPLSSVVVPSSQHRRLMVLDTCILTSDIIASLKDGQPTSLLAGMRYRTVRGFVTHRVWAEVPRVLEDRAREGEPFDLAAASRLWWGSYVPVLYVVDVDEDAAATDSEVQTLAARDKTDVPTLALQTLLAPAALLTTDPDLIASGRVYRDWGAVRAALGKMGLAEQEAEELMQAVTAMVGFPMVVAFTAADGAVRVARAYPVPALAAAVVMFEVGRRLRKRNRGVYAAKVKPAIAKVTTTLLEELARSEEQRRSGEMVWQSAQRGDAGEPMVCRVARLLALRGPMNRTEIVAALGDVDGLRHRVKMDRLLGMLQRSPMFVEVERGRWQLGRQGVAFGHPAAIVLPPMPVMARRAALKASAS